MFICNPYPSLFLCLQVYCPCRQSGCPDCQLERCLCPAWVSCCRAIPTCCRCCSRASDDVCPTLRRDCYRRRRRRMRLPSKCSSLLQPCRILSSKHRWWVCRCLCCFTIDMAAAEAAAVTTTIATAQQKGGNSSVNCISAATCHMWQAKSNHKLQASFHTQATQFQSYFSMYNSFETLTHTHTLTLVTHTHTDTH